MRDQQCGDGGQVELAVQRVQVGVAGEIEQHVAVDHGLGLRADVLASGFGGALAEGAAAEQAGDSFGGCGAELGDAHGMLLRLRWDG